MSAILINKFM